MLAEYLSHADFEDLDKCARGEAPCSVFKGEFTGCENCDNFKDKEYGCMGAMYHIPSSADFLLLQKKWEENYGMGSSIRAIIKLD